MSLATLVLVLAAVCLWPGARPVPVVGGEVGGRTGQGHRPAGSEARGPSAVRWSAWRPGRGARTRDLEALAGVAELLAMALRSGATPVVAVRVVARRAPRPWGEVLADVGERLATGDDAGGVWRKHAREHPELRPLAGAWQLSEDLGVALAPSMSTSAQVLRAQVEGRRRLDVATAGARATMRLLTALPLLGLLAGSAFGLAPWEVYGHDAVTMASATLGLLLTGIGWAVCHVVLRRAAEPERHR